MLSLVMEYRVNVVFKCLLVPAVGVGCVAAGVLSIGVIGILIAFFAGCLCRSGLWLHGANAAFIMLLGIRAVENDNAACASYMWQN